ncbi:L-asparaginase [Pantoea coffeiphila]|uniref:L-asparaginase n=1 Tax=Pantoea coffeiphila TaxID=1465635 RepID=A0A2S9IH33_9GAMM|nr:L-asparaginase [Pantoea coffeiphila]
MFAILHPGSAQNPHVLRVRSGSCALSVCKLPAPVTPEALFTYRNR